MAINQDLDKVLDSGHDAKVPDLDWASLDVKDYDNIPTTNPVEVVPQLVAALSNSPEKGARLSGYVDVPAEKKASDNTEKAVGELVACAKREMMKGLKGRELAMKLASLFPPAVVGAAREPLAKAAEEQGLLGNVYIDLSVFDSCREAAQTLGPNRVRLADYVVGSPRRHSCGTHSEGYCRELHKTAVESVPYGTELFSKYTKHLRVAGLIGAAAEVSDKDTLRQALLKDPVKKHTTSIEIADNVGVKEASLGVGLDEALGTHTTSRDAAMDKYAGARPVLAYMQDQMLRGVVGEDLKSLVGDKFPVDVIKECKGEMHRLASLQGLVGNVYVDVGYYKSADDASRAIASAKTKPSYIVNTSPSAEHDGRIASVSKATGCRALPSDGMIDPKVAATYIDDLHFSGRISSDRAKAYASRLAAGDKPLTVLREAFLSDERPGKERKSAAQVGTWFTGSKKGHEDRSALEFAAKKALGKGVSIDKVQTKLASCVPTAEAVGMVHSIVAGLEEIDASCLPNCASHRYPLMKSARIKMASKCQTCVSRTCTSCLSQGLKFAGAVDYDKAFLDMTVLEATDKSKKNKKGGKYDPKDDTAPEIQKVLLKDNPDVQREDMKQKYDPSTEEGSGGNETLDKMRGEGGEKKVDK